MASKGKGIADKGSSGKRKRDKDDKSGHKRKNRDVLQFFEDAAFEDGDSDSSFDFDGLFDDTDFIDELDSEPKVADEPGRSEQVRLFPKEEELSGDELEKMLIDRYSSGSGFVKYAEDGYDSKRSVDRNFLIPSVQEPMIWKVKCKVGRERHTVFCLMQKYVDLKGLGNKLRIITAFAVELIKGFVFIEAERQSDVTEASNQLADVYFSLITKVPVNEVSQLLMVRQRYNEVKEGTWARVKNGIYRGDIAQVVTVNKERKKATVKLIPRVDMQALIAKYGGGTVAKKTKNAVPAARLISPSELEEFRPLMQCRRDRDTGNVFEFLDGLMLKDGFLYKKISIDSLSFWDVNPTEEELQKFALPGNDESDNLEWLSQLYGEQKKKPKVSQVTISKGGEKGAGSSGSNEQSSFEVHDLVLFGKRDFGMVIGMEKDESFKILKYGSEGSVTMTLGQKDLKYLPLEKKFTALDLHMKTISINDTVRILHGPSKDRQGIVKQIYRGIIFLYDENDFDNAFICAKSQDSEKVRHIDSSCRGKDEGTSGFEDVPSSPKSPLSAKRPWQMREDEGRDKDGTFSVGQSLRIRIGPLKGYLCRVVAVRFTDVTVKLDSQQKVLTVKRDHLAEVRGKSTATSMSDDAGLNSSFKPFDLLGSDGTGNDWLQGASGSAEGDGWNVQGLTGDRSAWPAFSSAGASAGTSAGALPSSVDNDSGRDAGDDAWGSKVNDNKKSSWGDKTASSSDQGGGGWGSSDGGWGKTSGTDLGKKDTEGQGAPWDKGKNISNESSWGKQSADKGVTDAWSKGKGAEETGGWGSNGSLANADSSGWGKRVGEKSESLGKVTDSQPSGGSWGEPKGAGSWGNVSSGDNAGSSGWGKKVGEKSETWGKGTELQDQSMSKPGGDAWGQGKGTSGSAEDSWGKSVGTWGNKNSANSSSEWKSSGVASGLETGGWGQAQGQNASGGWKNNLDGQSNEKWGKSENASGWGKGVGSSQGVQSWNGSEGTRSWDQGGSNESDQGYRGRGFGGRRGRGGNRGGRDESGGGRGWSSGGGRFSSSNQENQSGSSWGGSNDGGNSKSWNNNLQGEGKGGSVSGWAQGSSENSSKWNSADPSSERGNDSDGWKQQTSWDKGKSGDDKWGSMGNSSGSKAWGSSANTTVDDNKGWGKGIGSSTESQDENPKVGWAGGSGWKNSGDDDDKGKMNSWGKSKSFGGGSSENESWDQSKSFENDRGGRGFGGGRTGRGRDQFGRGRGRSFDRGNSRDGQEGGWRGGGYDNSDGGGSWIKPGGNFDNDQGFGRGRGSGGRRGGRGGFRGGGYGGSSGRDQSSSWKNDNESGGGSSWGNTSGGGGSSWSNTSSGGKSSWGNTSGGGGVGSWGNTSGGGNSSWSNTSSGGDNKGWGAKPSQGGSTNDQVGGWGNQSKGATDNAANKDSGGVSWGNKPNDGTTSWGGGKPSNDQGNKGWGNEKQSAGAGGNSWGASKGVSKPSEGTTSSWGGSKPNNDQGNSGWGNEKQSTGGGNSWGADKDASKPSEGTTSWGTGKTNEEKNTEKGSDPGSSWGKSTSGGSGGGGGWA